MRIVGLGEDAENSQTLADVSAMNTNHDRFSSTTLSKQVFAPQM